ncbi:DEAD/DEAH box helicase [Desulfoluna spongiiphila]|uniref:ATP-dependent RNA helicase RhlE n=1 Tax=Desulfoluna spongiiphila TaxID=419481 RepID=A0A1G5EK56_9BACT|nr:DEAD/DEAH box helicase [Desulfoluna spongiiphila]SCY27344.1 ATP-dependent RNA helicase RhlE [Desulfoluna spongiiphila]VVS91176.1 rna helicase dead-box type q motif [Desulfoluna spongiiphila]
MKFDQYYISADIKKNLAQLGFKRPTDIQFKAIPSIQKGEDVLAIAQTGTGKTAAFAIPLIDRIQRGKSSKRSYGIRCIVMVPTRELAAQIGEVFESLSRHTKVKTFALYGGVEQDAQIKKLQGGIDVLVATPGRMFDLISQGYIGLDRIDTLVLDEADRMLDLGFIDDIRFVKKKITRKHQTLFFSATINEKIKKLAFSQVKSSAIRIQLSPEDPVSKNVSHAVMFVEMDDKRFFLERYVRDNPESKMVVFVRTRVRAERVAKAMARVGIEALSIHGEKDQGQRLEAMKAFKEGACRMLIATDVSARGIDIPDVTVVINYDLPEVAENYVHRVGRTGRGMNKGVALSFCSKEEKDRLEEIQGFLGKEIEVLRVGKTDYAATLHFSNELSAEELIAEQEAFEKNRKKKKRRK